MDFTLITYSRLLKALQNSGYSFQTFVDFINNPKDKVVVMRHDVDRLPGNALKMAGIEHGMGIAVSDYFRATNGVGPQQVPDIKHLIINFAL